MKTAALAKSIELDLNLIDFYDRQLSKVEWHIQKQPVKSISKV